MSFPFCHTQPRLGSHWKVKGLLPWCLHPNSWCVHGCSSPFKNRYVPQCSPTGIFMYIHFFFVLIPRKWSEALDFGHSMAFRFRWFPRKMIKTWFPQCWTQEGNPAEMDPKGATGCGLVMVSPDGESDGDGVRHIVGIWGICKKGQWDMLRQGPTWCNQG